MLTLGDDRDPDRQNFGPDYSSFASSSMKSEAKKQKRKERAWTQYRKSGLMDDHRKARRESKEMIKLTKKLCMDFERDLAKNSKKNPKAFWKHCNSRLKARSGIADLEMTHGKITENDGDKAETLNTFFSSVFSKVNLE